jgi:PAS domain S-box-containing protein
VTLDVSDRKSAEEAIKESELNYRSIFNAANDAIFVLELETGKIIDVNGRMCEMYNCTAEQAKLQAPTDLSSNEAPYTEEKAFELIRKASAGEPQIFEWQARKYTGELFWVEVSLRHIVLRGNECLLAIVRDITDRKRAQQQLAESHGRITDVLESIGDAFYSLDKNLCFTYVNRKTEELWKIKREDLLGRSLLEVFPQGVGTHAHQMCVRALRTNEPMNFETFSTVIGRWVDASIYPTMNGLSVYFRDTTERKQALDKLRQSEEQFGKAFRANPQPMSITTTATGKYLDVNDSFLHMSGYARPEVIGHTSLELNIWETPEARADFIREVQTRGQVRNLETHFRTKDGSFRVLLSSAEQLEIGGEQCLLLASSDITERVKAQAAVAESEARFRTMADTAPVMIWVSGQDKGCTYFNQRWLDFTGRTMDEQLGTAWVSLVHPDNVEKCLKTYTTAFDKREPFTMECRLRRADGAYRWVIDNATPRFSPSGEFLGYIGSCVDITDRKQSEAELVVAHEALETAYAEVNRLKTQLEEENIYLQEEIKLQHNFGEIVGQSDPLKHVLFKIEQVAPTDSTVLIAGETGTGKELVARAIHTASLRADRPMVKVNCAALSPTLIESELFGHEKGAFTGAISRKIGRFELADGATIFLDEIGELPLELQVKLLRVIQEGEVERLGSITTVKVDVRVIAATNRNLTEQVNKGLFREDLWYRLNVFPITVPPLRQRRQDIPTLVEHFVQTFARKIGKKIDSIAPSTMNSLCSYAWPGNVRELANVIERAVINSHGGVLRIQEQLRSENAATADSITKTLEEMERDYIMRVLESQSWRIEGPNGAARLLGLNPSTLRTRITKLGIIKPYQRAAGSNGS